MTTLEMTSSASIAPAADLTDTLMISQYAQTADLSVPVEVRRYAGGRDRVISSPGATTRVSVSFRYMSRANLQFLTDLTGVLVLFRDNRQRRFWGVVGDVSATEYLGRDLLENISFTLTSVSYTEVV